MIRVKNGPAIRRISYGSLKAAGKRNLVAVLAIALTCLLFTGVLTVGLSLVDYMENQTMRQVGTSAHGGFKMITRAQYDKVAEDPEIKDISYNIYIGSGEDEALTKLYTEIRYSEEKAARWGFCYPEEGRMPEAEDEIACDTAVLKALGVPAQLGEKVELTVKIDGRLQKDTFTLCGFWEGDPIVPAHEILVSRAWADRYAPTPEIPYLAQKDGRHEAGYLSPTFYFRSSWDLEGQMTALKERCGFGTDVTEGINWAYQTSSVDGQTILFAAGMLLLIAAAGYLIIYNIFAISVSRDIHFYGLLKTVGTTGRQLRKIVYRQAFLLSAIGIPLGLLAGWLVGKFLMPVVMSGTSFSDDASAVEVTASPVIFAGSLLLSLITVWISCLKPCRMASRISPVDAVRWNEAGDSRKDTPRREMRRKRVPERKVTKKTKRVTEGMMAAENLKRSRSRTMVVVLSLTLSLTLLNCIITVVNGYNQEKYLDEQMPCDYVLTDASIINFASYQNYESIPDELMEEVQQLDGVEAVGRTWGTDTFLQVSGRAEEKVRQKLDYVKTQRDETYWSMEAQRLEEDGQVICSLYGADDMVLEYVELLRGQLDLEKFRSGNYIIAGPGIVLDDPQASADTAYYDVGDSVEIHWTDGTTSVYEVMAIGEMQHAMGTRSSFLLGVDLILPASEYLKHVPSKGGLSLSVDCSDDAAGEEAGRWLEAYCENSTSTVYDSRETIAEEFESMNQMILRVGGALSAILALIAVLNFINAMVTSVFTRQRELAMLESVGMTRRQMLRMLMTEGCGQIMLGILLAASAGSLICMGIGRFLETQTWFFTWHPVFWPFLISAPVLLVLAVAVPVFAFRSMEKASIVERLRAAE
ncbi:MAG: ABC transporter permease [Anaerovoracaceae bacterium]